MRIARNLLILALLLAAPVMAKGRGTVGDAGDASTCGSCTCDPGQCCKMSWAGGCECYTCTPDP